MTPDGIEAWVRVLGPTAILAILVWGACRAVKELYAHFLRPLGGTTGIFAVATTKVSVAISSFLDRTAAAVESMPAVVEDIRQEMDCHERKLQEIIALQTPEAAASIETHHRLECLHRMHHVSGQMISKLAVNQGVDVSEELKQLDEIVVEMRKKNGDL